MILYIENPNDPAKTLLDVIHEASKMAGNKNQYTNSCCVSIYKKKLAEIETFTTQQKEKMVRNKLTKGGETCTLKISRLLKETEDKKTGSYSMLIN